MTASRHGSLRALLLAVAGAVLAGTTLTGCGQTGPLTLPGPAAGQGAGDGTDPGTGGEVGENEDGEENER